MISKQVSDKNVIKKSIVSIPGSEYDFMIDSRLTKDRGYESIVIKVRKDGRPIDFLRNRYTQIRQCR